MLYSKRRKNLGGGRKKRSNRRSYVSNRLRMSGGENDKYHFVLQKIENFNFDLIANDHFIKTSTNYKFDHKLPKNQVPVRIIDVYVNGVLSYTARRDYQVGLLFMGTYMGYEEDIQTLLLPIKSSTKYETYGIRNRLYTNPEVGPHNTVEFVN